MTHQANPAPLHDRARLAESLHKLEDEGLFFQGVEALLGAGALEEAILALKRAATGRGRLYWPRALDVLAGIKAEAAGEALEWLAQKGDLGLTGREKLLSLLAGRGEQGFAALQRLAFSEERPLAEAALRALLKTGNWRAQEFARDLFDSLAPLLEAGGADRATFRTLTLAAVAASALGHPPAVRFLRALVFADNASERVLADMAYLGVYFRSQAVEGLFREALLASLPASGEAGGETCGRAAIHVALRHFAASSLPAHREFLWEMLERYRQTPCGGYHDLLPLLAEDWALVGEVDCLYRLALGAGGPRGLDMVLRLVDKTPASRAQTLLKRLLAAPSLDSTARLGVIHAAVRLGMEEAGRSLALLLEQAEQLTSTDLNRALHLAIIGRDARLKPQITALKARHPSPRVRAACDKFLAGLVQI